MKQKLEANLWKYLIVVLTERRNYIPILSIYFLSLPGSTAQQLGFFTAVGWIMGFILEIPSGYISDLFGHKRTLFLSKICMLISTLSFVYGSELWNFVLGASFLSIGFAFMSGTGEAFLHNTLTNLKREKEYATINGKIHANASFVSALLILSLPLLTKISLVMPIKAYLLLDIIGLIVVLTLHSPKMKYTAEDEEGENILSQLHRFKGSGFYLASLYLALIGGFVTGFTPYKEPYLQSLGLPIILMGAVMGLSRFVWFAIGHNLHHFEKVKMKNLFFCEALYFSGSMLLVSWLNQPYVIVVLMALWFGYHHARRSVMEKYFLEHFLVNKRFKATMLSIQRQFISLVQSCIVLGFGGVMSASYSQGYFLGSLVLFVSLMLLTPSVRRIL